MDAVYMGRGRMMIKPPYGGFLFTPSDDLSITPMLVAQGFLEAPLMHYLWRKLEVGSTFVDVGANIGFFSILAAHKVGSSGKLVAVEANPLAASYLRDNLTANWLTDRDVTVVEAAASDAAGTVTFHQSDRFMGDSSVNGCAEGLADRQVSVREVPAITLDDVLKDVPRIDVLKMDIEGGEHKALLGMRKTLSRGAVGTLVIEWNPAMLGEDSADALAHLLHVVCNDAAASCHVLDDEGVPHSVDLSSVLALPSYPFLVIDFPAPSSRSMTFATCATGAQ